MITTALSSDGALAAVTKTGEQGDVRRYGDANRANSAPDIHPVPPHSWHLQNFVPPNSAAFGAAEVEIAQRIFQVTAIRSPTDNQEFATWDLLLAIACRDFAHHHLPRVCALRADTIRKLCPLPFA